MAIDDHARIAFTQMHPNESNGYAIAFLRAAVAYYATLSITIRRVPHRQRKRPASTVLPSPR